VTTRIDRASIERTYGLITPYIRVTPVVETSGADFGLAAFPLAFKLELFQHAGSFKTRGAFANLLTREIHGADGGRAALAQLDAHSYDLVVSDLRMPEVDGVQIYREVQAQSAPRRVGELMFPIAQAHIARVLLVSDAAIRQAQDALWATLRVVAEPGGAAAFAALLRSAYVPAPGERVGVVVSGGNTTAVDFDR